MVTSNIKDNTTAPRTGEDEGSAFDRDLTVFFEFAGKAAVPKQLEMWRWLNSLGNSTNEK